MSQKSNKRLLIFLGHPAHFHMFKNSIRALENEKVEILVLIKQKDILEDLCKEANLTYINILPKYQRTSKISVIRSFLIRYIKVSKYVLNFKPNLLIGSEPSIGHVAWFFRKKSFVFCEDDISVIPLFAKITFPFVTKIVAPKWCDVGKWTHKKIAYNGFQKLAYLDPHVFKPSEKIRNEMKLPFVFIRISKQNAYHDVNASGISESLLDEIIQKVKTTHQVYISFESNPPKKYSDYVLPKTLVQHVHSVLSFADLYIGDSQSMSVEAALLGTPGIRIGSFKNKISVLNYLEEDLKMTSSFYSNEHQLILEQISKLLTTESKNGFHKRADEAIKNFENVPQFFTHLIRENLK